MIVFFRKSAFAIFCTLSVSGVTHGQGMSSEEFFNQVSVVLQSPEGRAKMKNVIGQWTPQQKKDFSASFSQQASEKMAPLLPMQIDRDNTWTSLRFSDQRIFLHVGVSDAILNDDEYFSANESRMLNHMCTTPSNALLLMTGYTVQMDYYSQNGVHLKQLGYSADDCDF